MLLDTCQQDELSFYQRLTHQLEYDYPELKKSHCYFHSAFQRHHKHLEKTYAILRKEFFDHPSENHRVLHCLWLHNGKLQEQIQVGLQLLCVIHVLLNFPFFYSPFPEYKAGLVGSFTILFYSGSGIMGEAQCLPQLSYPLGFSQDRRQDHRLLREFPGCCSQVRHTDTAPLHKRHNQ